MPRKKLIAIWLVGAVFATLIALNVIGCPISKLQTGTYIGRAMRIHPQSLEISFYHGDDPGVVLIQDGGRFELYGSHGDGVAMAEGTFKTDGSYVTFSIEKLSGQLVVNRKDNFIVAYFSGKGKFIDLNDERFQLDERSRNTNP